MTLSPPPPPDFTQPGRLTAPRIGLYYDLRNPGAERPWPKVYATALDQIVRAEKMGIDAIWVTEHHGFADGYLPQPLVFCAAIAARTSRVRVGTGIVISPLMHPVALAEQASVVDLVSGGRLELGLGAGWREEEFATFGADHRGRYDELERGASALAGLWRDGTATPPPCQDPMPLWVGARGPRGSRIAGRLGAGLLWLDPDLMVPYCEGLDAAGHDRSSARMGGLLNVFLSDDPERARATIVERARGNRKTYRGADVSKREKAFAGLEFVTAAKAAARIVALCEAAPVTDVFCFASIGGSDDVLTEQHVALVSAVLPSLVAKRLAAAAL
jgi:alkanesulfonate monooxygenase SsuD/methylene tetrahydromethanopterin reductase-like flavin-dependent oxidoreductase (luciferase family)